MASFSLGSGLGNQAGGSFKEMERFTQSYMGKGKVGGPEEQ